MLEILQRRLKTFQTFKCWGVGHFLMGLLPSKYALAISKKVGVDVRSVWERQRLKFLASPSSCFDVKYYRLRMVYLINPPRMGLFWSCAMESTFRIFSLVWFSENIGDNKIKKVNRLIELECKNIEENLEKHSFNNHYFFNVIGLCLGARRTAYRTKIMDVYHELHRCYQAQFYPDGGNFEASTAYHLLVTFALLELSEFDLRAKEYLKSRANWPDAILLCSYILGRNNQAFQVGDNDSSYLFFNKQLCKTSASSDSNTRSDDIIYPDFGAIFLARDAVEIGFFNFPNGQMGKNGHSHNDFLSLQVRINGTILIGDPGTYSYSCQRNVFRQASSHSCPMIFGREPEEPISNFQMTGDSRRTLSHSQNGLQSTSGGTLRFQAHELHRTICTHSNVVTVEDNFSSNADVKVTSFIIPPQVNVSVDLFGFVLSTADGQFIKVEVSDNPEIIIDKCFYSEMYGKLGIGKRISIYTKESQSKILWSLSWR